MRYGIYDLKVCDDGSLIKFYCVWTLSTVLFLLKNPQRFGDWIMSPSSGGTYSGPEIGTSSIDWAQLSRCHLKTETESSLRNVVGFLVKTRPWVMSRHRRILCVMVCLQSNNQLFRGLLKDYFNIEIK
jgi:hypothetical protein